MWSEESASSQIFSSVLEGGMRLRRLDRHNAPGGPSETAQGNRWVKSIRLLSSVDSDPPGIAWLEAGPPVTLSSQHCCPTGWTEHGPWNRRHHTCIDCPSLRILHMEVCQCTESFVWSSILVHVARRSSTATSHLGIPRRPETMLNEEEKTSNDEIGVNNRGPFRIK